MKIKQFEQAEQILGHIKELERAKKFIEDDSVMSQVTLFVGNQKITVPMSSSLIKQLSCEINDELENFKKIFKEI